MLIRLKYARQRTLPDCEEQYTKRVRGIEIFGQALPITHLDYRAGVGLVFSEPPTGHTTLMFASQRGSAYAFDRSLWGVHNANHIPRMPADGATERRNFILLWQAWLYGARLMYDEESALYALHDAPRSFADWYTFNRRRQMQELYHYASAIDLGREVVRIGFLQGRYDCLVGGLQSGPDTKRSKVWGMIGPETPAWEYNTPERGWELLDTFMPGVWLYPVLQDPTRMRQFFGGSPYGQVDLVPGESPPEKLSKYRLLVLPGWNSMSEEMYERLIRYVHDGGHLVLSAAQCTRHVTRDFLLDKDGFQCPELRRSDRAGRGAGQRGRARRSPGSRGSTGRPSTHAASPASRQKSPPRGRWPPMNMATPCSSSMRWGRGRSGCSRWASTGGRLRSTRSAHCWGRSSPQGFRPMRGLREMRGTWTTIFTRAPTDGDA